MRIKVLLVAGSVLVFAALQVEGSADAQGVFSTVHVDVKIDCLPGRGVAFSLTPWSIVVRSGDSINWRLDPGAGVTEMQVLGKTGRPWPFGRKPPYRVTKERPAGARSPDLNQPPGRYQYAVSAICVRDAEIADTVLIDPDMIIPKR